MIPTIETLRDIISNQLGIPAAKIREHTPLRPLFDEYETNNIDLIDIGLALEEKFQIEVPIEELQNWKNPTEAAAFINAAPKIPNLPEEDYMPPEARMD